MPGYPTPQTMAEARLGMIDWFRTYTSRIWPEQHLSGSHFIAPPSLPPIKAKSVGYQINPLTRSALQMPRESDRAQFIRLAEYYASNFERAKMYYLSEEMTNLALRTEMPQYRLTADMLPAPEGFLVWGQPIGDAQQFIPRTAWVGLDGSLTENTEDPPEGRPSIFKDADTPVIGAAWRYEPDHNTVWLSIYTRNDGILDSLMREMPEDQREMARALTPPLGFEREQGLPMDVTLNWFDADPKDGRKLEATAFSDLAELPEHLHVKARTANKDVEPQLTAMVRTLVATFLLMKWKIAHREEITAPHTAVKQMARATGRPRETVREGSKTTVVRLGQPLRHRKPAKGAASRKWKVRTLVGPHIRTRQYIPAWDTYDDTPRLIEPYIAGPEGAPLSKTARVFLLE